MCVVHAGDLPQSHMRKDTGALSLKDFSHPPSFLQLISYPDEVYNNHSSGTNKIIEFNKKKQVHEILIYPLIHWSWEKQKNKNKKKVVDGASEELSGPVPGEKKQNKKTAAVIDKSFWHQGQWQWRSLKKGFWLSQMAPVHVVCRHKGIGSRTSSHRDRTLDWFSATHQSQPSEHSRTLNNRTEQSLASWFASRLSINVSHCSNNTAERVSREPNVIRVTTEIQIILNIKK